MSTPPKELSATLADAEELIRKRGVEIRNLKASLRGLQQRTDHEKEIREQIYKIAAQSPEPPDWLIRLGKAGFRGTPCTIWSDWHYGEVVNGAEVVGMNEFNATVCERRVKRLVERTIDLAFNHMGKPGTDYPGIVVMLGGDMISGAIHEELLATDDRTANQGVVELAGIISAALVELRKKFKRVFVPCVVGNHGRSTRLPRNKHRVHTSFDWNIYCFTAKYLERDKGIQFYIPQESDAFFKVHGHRFLLTHGDSLGVKGGDGIIGAAGPIMRGAIKVGRSEAQIGRNFDTLVMGHWHQYLTLPGIIVNNSLIGYNEYARLSLRAPYSRPSQALWFTHPEHGITAHWQVYLERQLPTESVRDWVVYPNVHRS